MQCKILEAKALRGNIMKMPLSQSSQAKACDSCDNGNSVTSRFKPLTISNMRSNVTL